MSHDERGRVEALMRYTENIGYDAVYYTYNAMNQVASICVADPLNRFTTWYGYDFNGRIDTVWSQLTEGAGLGTTAPHKPEPGQIPRANPDAVLSYDARGQVDSVQYPPVLGLVRYAWNPRRWLDSLVVHATDGTGSSFLFSEKLLYDLAGRITQQQWQHRGSPAEFLDYGNDGASRLTSWGAMPLVGATTYLYDPAGNRMTTVCLGDTVQPPWSEMNTYVPGIIGP